MALFLLPLGSLAQDTAAPEILIVWQDDSAEYKQALDKFIQSLDKSLSEKCQTVSSGMLSQKPDDINFDNADLCVVIGSKATVMAVKRVPQGIPVAYCMVYSPEKIGLVNAPQNFGVSLAVSIQDQFDLIAKVLPYSHTKATMCTESQYSDKSWPVNELQSRSDMKYIQIPDKIKNSERALWVNRLMTSGADMVWTYPDSNVFHLLTMKMLLLESVKRKIPVFGYSENMVKAGALLGVSVEPQRQGSQLAEMVNAFMSGQQLAVKHKTAEFKPVFNLAVADMMKINVPDELILQARYVYGR
ncbi:MAG: hypothetical protein JW745_09800 [Sedimentisphaerales bacterium]|nr:hypothetical protein [Sedimentisphaerales bacterium]